MAELMTDDWRWVNGVAARLRVLQANFADAQPAVCQGYIVEEIERALKQLPSNRRKSCLTTLAEQFPAWQATGEAVKVGKVKPPTADELLEQFVELAAEMPEATRSEFVRKLEDSGLAPKVKPAGAALNLPPEAQRKLGLGPGDPLDGERAAKLLARLAEVIMALDQFVWALWRDLAPNSNVRREGEVSKLLGPCLKGDPEISTQLVSQNLERTRRLIAAVLGGIGGAGAGYAAKFTQRFSAEAILSLADLEKSFIRAREVEAWKIFVNLSKQYATEPAIEKEIRQAIVTRAENLMAGRINI